MRSKLFLAGISVILLYMLPYVILGEDAYITIHDFLDQNVVIIAMLKKTGLLTSLSGVVPNMDGLDRSLFPYFTPFDIKMVSYALLPTYWAIVTYTLAYKIVAFIGMYLLLDTYVFDNRNRQITCLLSLGFAFVPFYMELALSGAGFPLVAYAFLNLHNNRLVGWSYVMIAFYTFNSLLAYGGFFFLVVLFCCLMYNYYRTKRIAWGVVYGVVFMCVIYILANWGTIYSLFFSESFLSHRSEWMESATFIDKIREYVDILLWSQIHSGTLFAMPVFMLFVYYFFKYKSKYSILKEIAYFYILVIVGIFVGMILKLSQIQLFISIQFDRFYFLYPSAVFLSLASVCFVAVKEHRLKLAFLFSLFGLVCGIVNDHEIRCNLRLLANQQINVPSFKQFYDVALFSKIQSDLGLTSDYQTKVVSVGIYPAIAEYNGFYTIDSYRVNYPVEFKHKFRKIIEKELDKDAFLCSYFDDWGSRCYIFSAELIKNGNQFLCRKSDKESIRLEINTNILKDFGCEYILSAVDINNFRDLNLAYINSYTTDQSIYNIRVYKLK